MSVKVPYGYFTALKEQVVSSVFNSSGQGEHKDNMTMRSTIIRVQTLKIGVFDNKEMTLKRPGKRRETCQGDWESR